MNVNNKIMPKILVILIIFLGETLAILAEITSAKYFAIDHNSFSRGVIRAIPIMLTGSLLLVFGYMLGLKNFKKYLDCQRCQHYLNFNRRADYQLYNNQTIPGRGCINWF